MEIEYAIICFEYALSRRLVTIWTKVVVFDMRKGKNAHHAVFWNLYFLFLVI